MWSEIFRLITALIEINPDKFSKHKKSVDSYKESYDIFASLLDEIGHKSFIKSVCESIESKTAQGKLFKCILSNDFLLIYYVHSFTNISSTIFNIIIIS